MFDPKRIKEARVGAEMTMEELADLVNSNKQTVFKYEKGIVMPPPSMLEKIAIGLNRKLDFFFSPTDGLKLDSISFRTGVEEAAIRLSNMEDNIISEILIINELELLSKDKIDFKNPLSSFEINKMSDVEDAAEKLREKWKLGVSSISNVTEVLEQKGIIVVEKYSPYLFDGFSAFLKERPLIVLNSRKNEITRRRFTALHELFHILSTKIIISDKMKERIEEICDAFAGAILLPLQILKDFWEGRRAFYMQDFINLKESFGISIKAIWIRAINKNLLSWSTYHKWKEAYKAISNLGKYAGIETPKRSEKLILKCITSKKITVEKAIEKAKFLGNGLEKQIKINMIYNLAI